MAFPRRKSVEDRRAGHLREVGPGDEGSSVAAEITAARMRHGGDLRDIAEDLRIRHDHLAALEEGRFDDLPGPTYVIGFLRSYATYLELDAEDLVQRFKAEAAGYGAPPKLHFPSPAEEGRVPTGSLLVAALVLAGTAYAGWYYVTSVDNSATNAVPGVPQHLASIGSDPVDAAAAAAVPEVAEAPPSVPLETQATMPATPAGSAVAALAPVESSPESSPEPDPPAAVQPAPSPPPEPVRAVEPEPAPTPEPVPVAEPAPQPAPEPVVAVAPEPEPEPVVERAVVAETAPDPVPELAPVPAPEPRSASAGEITVTALEAPQETPVVQREPLAPAAITLPIGEGGAAAAGDSAPREAPQEAASEVVTATAAPDIPPPPSGGTGYVPRIFGQANVDSRIEVRTTQESWVQVTGLDNELLLTRILRPGDVYRVPNRPGLELMTGNAGAVQIYVDGKRAPALGPIGSVRRGVSLDPVLLFGGTVPDPR